MMTVYAILRSVSDWRHIAKSEHGGPEQPRASHSLRDHLPQVVTAAMDGAWEGDAYGGAGGRAAGASRKDSCPQAE